MTPDPQPLDRFAADGTASLLDACSLPLAVIDAGFQLVHVNPAFCAACDIDGDEATGRTLGELFAELADDEDFLDALEQAVAGTPLVDYRVNPDGSGKTGRDLRLSARPIEADAGRPRGLLVELRDKTNARVEAEAERKNRALLEAVQRVTSDAILTIYHDGRIRSFSPAAEKLFGLDADAAVGEHIDRFVTGSTAGRIEDFLQRHLQDPSPDGPLGEPRPFTGIRADGSRVPIEITIKEIDDDAQFSCSVRDMSERRRMEQEILNIATIEQQRIGRELHDDTLQALAAMQMMTEDLVQMVKEPESDAGRLARSLAESARLANRRARLMARGVIPRQTTAGSLRQAISSMARDMSELYSVTIKVEERAESEPDDGRVATHALRIAQEATKNAAWHSDSAEITITLSNDDERFVIEVADEGLGIGTNELPSEGFGLNIMAYRADLIGAEFTIEDREPSGTTVRVAVPMSLRQ